MSPSELQRWTLIRDALQARGTFTLTDRELGGLTALIALAEGAPAAADIVVTRAVYQPEKRQVIINRPAKCDCRRRLLGLLGTATVLQAQVSAMVRGDDDA